MTFIQFRVDERFCPLARETLVVVPSSGGSVRLQLPSPSTGHQHLEPLPEAHNHFPCQFSSSGICLARRSGRTPSSRSVAAAAITATGMCQFPSLYVLFHGFFMSVFGFHTIEFERLWRKQHSNARACCVEFFQFYTGFYLFSLFLISRRSFFPFLYIGFCFIFCGGVVI